jgi:hypothetical protein
MNIAQIARWWKSESIIKHSIETTLLTTHPPQTAQTLHAFIKLQRPVIWLF